MIHEQEYPPAHGAASEYAGHVSAAALTLPAGLQDGGAGLEPRDAVAQQPASIVIRDTVDLKKEPLLKRPLDVALAGAMLAASAPVWALIAAAIKLEDGGPVFYRQERWGRGGTRFGVRKFRTMVPDAEQKFGLRQATQDDHRVTRIGRVLRATGLDELPQLLNIFRGEMSFVGPRALAVAERDQAGRPMDYERRPGFLERASVRPGLTGLATVHLPKDASAERKFRTDLLYVRRQSFWLDLRLIGLSFWISFRGKWETRGSKV